MSMKCFDCGNEFKDGDEVLEICSGTYSAKDGCVWSNESLEAWCMDCNGKRGEK